MQSNGTVIDPANHFCPRGQACIVLALAWVRRTAQYFMTVPQERRALGKATRGDHETAQVAAAVDLLGEGATVPFIARYRKEATKGLDEVALRYIEDALAKAQERNEAWEHDPRFVDPDDEEPDDSEGWGPFRH